jgi:uncharacterized membrane protein
MLLPTLFRSVAGGAFLGSLFWNSPRNCAILLLFAWVIAIGVFTYMNLPDRFLWIPVLLAGVGVFGPIFVLAIPAQITLAASAATLVLFVASLEVSSTKRWAPAFARKRV